MRSWVRDWECISGVMVGSQDSLDWASGLKEGVWPNVVVESVWKGL